MASSAFLSAVKAQKSGTKKDLGNLIVGQYLGEGEFNVTIQGVDTQFLANDQLAVSYATADGKVANDRMFLMDYRDKEAFSYQLRQFWSAVIPEQDAINKLLDALAVTDKAWGVFTGMGLQITLKRGPGFKINVIVDDSGDKKYFAVDAETGKEVTPYFYESQEAEDAAIAAGLRKSYLKIKGMAATTKQENLNAFYLAIEKVTAAASNSGGNTGAGPAKAAPTL